MILKFLLLFCICILIFFLFNYKESYKFTKKQNDFLHKKLIDLCRKITEIFNENNITYFIHSGTLLGSVREKNIIPHDDDIDIAIFPHDIEFLLSEEFERELKKYNLKFIPFKTNKGIIKVKDLNSKHGIFIDIFIFRKNGHKIEYDSEVSRSIWKNGWFDEKELFPLQLYQLGCLELFGPNDPYPYLNRHFGKDWNIPKTRKRDHHHEINLDETCYGECK